MTHTIGVFASLFEQSGKVVLVRQSYAGQCWTQPGGRLETGESPTEALIREILEETRMKARIDAYVGTYATPYRDDVLLHFRASVVAAAPWAPSDEIIACDAFDPANLPTPMRAHTRARVIDALRGRTNIFRTIISPDSAEDL